MKVITYKEGSEEKVSVVDIGLEVKQAYDLMATPDVWEETVKECRTSGRKHYSAFLTDAKILEVRFEI